MGVNSSNESKRTCRVPPMCSGNCADVTEHFVAVCCCRGDGSDLAATTTTIGSSRQRIVKRTCAEPCELLPCCMVLPCMLLCCMLPGIPPCCMWLPCKRMLPCIPPCMPMLPCCTCMPPMLPVWPCMPPMWTPWGPHWPPICPLTIGLFMLFMPMPCGGLPCICAPYGTGPAAMPAA